jgi:ankyrin repeat protein
VNAKTFDGNALISACSEGYIEVVKLLLANGASVNAETENNREPCSALVAAYGSGYLETVKLLIKEGANISS